MLEQLLQAQQLHVISSTWQLPGFNFLNKFVSATLHSKDNTLGSKCLGHGVYVLESSTTEL